MTLCAGLRAGINASPTNVKASPIFIDISPNVKVVPNSNKAPTYSAGIAIKPNPDPPTVTNEYGKVQTGPPLPLPALPGALHFPMAVAMLDVCCMAKARKRWGSLMTVSRAWSLASTLLVVSAVKPERQKACLTYHAKDAFHMRRSFAQPPPAPGAFLGKR